MVFWIDFDQHSGVQHLNNGQNTQKLTEQKTKAVLNYHSNVLEQYLDLQYWIVIFGGRLFMLMFFEIFTASESDLLLFGIMVMLTFFIYNINDSFKRASLIDNDTS